MGDVVQEAQAHCRALQEEYRKLIAHGTAIKSAKYLLEKDNVKAGEERGRWEKELAEAEVTTLLLEQELLARGERHRELKEYASACATLRQQMSASDRAAREKLAAKSDYLLSLPDEFYSGHLKEAKLEVAELHRQIVEARELEEEMAVVQKRLSTTLQENEHLSSALNSTQLTIDEVKNKLSTSEAELDWMTFAREETLSAKQDELENSMADLVGAGSRINELEAQVKALRDKEAFMQSESAQCALEKNSTGKIRFVQRVLLLLALTTRVLATPWFHASSSPAAQQSQALFGNELSSVAMVHAADHDDRMRVTVTGGRTMGQRRKGANGTFRYSRDQEFKAAP